MFPSDEQTHKKEQMNNRRYNFTKEATHILKKWLIDNAENPYLKHEDKVTLSRETGLSKK